MASMGLRSGDNEDEDMVGRRHHRRLRLDGSAGEGEQQVGCSDARARSLFVAERRAAQYPVLRASRKQRSRYHVLWPGYHHAQSFSLELAALGRAAKYVVDNVRPQTVGVICASGASFACKCGLILFLRVFLDKSWPVLQISSVCTLFLEPVRSFVPNAIRIALQPVKALMRPVFGLMLSRPLVRLAWPDAYRTARFWRRLLPIYFAYIRTKQNVRRKSAEDREKIWAKRHDWGGVKVHQLVLDMSGFYVKSAQILASKADFVPKAWIKHLSRHFDDQPPRPFSEVALSVRQQLVNCERGPFLPQDAKGLVLLNSVFLHLESTPLASASIAQVHGAVLTGGTRVVVKVQHLGMETYMHSDLRNIAWVAKFLQGQLPFDLTAVVKEIQQTIPLEFDFQREVWFMTRIKENLHSNGFEHIACPSPIEYLCTKRLIVMDRIDGVPFTRFLHCGTEERGRSAELVPLVEELLHAYGQMLLVDGIFHADPHAGNLLLLPDGRLGLIDFGQSKILDSETRLLLARMVLALADGSDAEIASALIETGMVFQDVRGFPMSESTLAVMARILFDTCYVEEATVSPMSDDSLLRTFPLTSFNQSLWMVIRTIVLLRGLCYQLDMNVSAAAIWRPFAATQLVTH